MSDLGINIEYYEDCLVETMPTYSQFQFQLAFGDSWKNSYLNNLEQLLESVSSDNKNSLFNNLNVIKQLLKEEKISHPDKLIYLINLELPHYRQHQGKGTKVLRHVLSKSKKGGFEYLLCNPVTPSGYKFVERNGFENIIGNYWGISIK